MVGWAGSYSNSTKQVKKQSHDDDDTGKTFTHDAYYS